MVDSEYKIDDNVYLITNARNYLQNGQVPLMSYKILSVRELDDLRYYNIEDCFGVTHMEVSEVVLYNKEELKTLFDGILKDVKFRYSKALEEERKYEQLLLFH